VLAERPLPGSDSCAFGDLHVHSQYSQSHVEFGPPIAAIDIISDTCGLDFVAITDHSYDLCCKISDYLQLDDSLERWKLLSKDVNGSSKSKTTIILGEEITTINSQNQAVHLCALGLTDFIPGSADGARGKKLETLEIGEVVRRIHNQDGLAIAAHPGSRFGLLQRIFLRRGNWMQADLEQDLDAIQAINNGFGPSWNTAKQLWIKELLKGKRLPLVAGNDAHGDFNRYRYISIPFILVSENFSRYLSSCRTGIYSKSKNIKEIISSIKNGETFVTNGPFLSLTCLKSDTNIVDTQRTIPLGCHTVSVSVESTSEFGMPRTISLFGGGKKTGCEVALFSETYAGNYSQTISISLDPTLDLSYVRAETTCERPDGSTTFAATSPLYFAER
jgi:predicted metal-dependent phosphoesterase TrpH